MDTLVVVEKCCLPRNAMISLGCGHTRRSMVKTATSQNCDKPERRHLFRETNKITLNTCSKRTLRGINCWLFLLSLLCYVLLFDFFVCVFVKRMTQFSAFSRLVFVVFRTFHVFSTHNTLLVHLLKFYPVKINAQLRLKTNRDDRLISFTEYRRKHS